MHLNLSDMTQDTPVWVWGGFLALLAPSFAMLLYVLYDQVRRMIRKWKRRRPCPQCPGRLDSHFAECPRAQP
jgi:hypothetical protein